jgi:hypothetical protein
MNPCELRGDSLPPVADITALAESVRMSIAKLEERNFFFGRKSLAMFS